MFMRVKMIRNNIDSNVEKYLLNLLFGEPTLPKLSDQLQEGWCIF